MSELQPWQFFALYAVMAFLVTFLINLFFAPHFEDDDMIPPPMIGIFWPIALVVGAIGLFAYLLNAAGKFGAKMHDATKVEEPHAD